MFLWSQRLQQVKNMNKKILEIKNLHTDFNSRTGQVHAVRGISLDVYQGEILGIVGESGSGKSVAMKSVMGLLPENASIQCDFLNFNESSLKGITKEEYRKIRGKEIAMIFQDPMTALNPLQKIGVHLTEVLCRHTGVSKKEAHQKAIEVLQMVGISNPEQRMKQYPHEFSGGMRQRVLIGMALCCQPKLLIADEPTTALDVTIQAQILELLKDMQEKNNTSIVLITHDMGVVASTCSRVAIMYGGLIMEEGMVEEIFYHSRHPYTQALLRAIPAIDLPEGERLQSIDGLPPSLMNPPKGCPFYDRCQKAEPQCKEKLPEYIRYSSTHRGMCHLETNEK